MKKFYFIPLIALSAFFGVSYLVGNVQPDKAAQDELTPDSVLADLKAGNERYQASKITDQDLGKRREMATSGQYPKAYILSCVDSRVPVETVFDQGIGDIFVGRVAGNVETKISLVRWNMLQL